jgi:hypothetical protein
MCQQLYVGLNTLAAVLYLETASTLRGSYGDPISQLYIGKFAAQPQQLARRRQSSYRGKATDQTALMYIA